MFPYVRKHHQIIYGCLRFTLKSVGRRKKTKKKRKEIEKIKCENSKSVYSRFLGDFYSHGTF